jgi:hypothetical protein
MGKLIPTGRVASFYLPADALDLLVGGTGDPLRESVRAYLTDQFSGFVHSPSPQDAAWSGADGRRVEVRMERYEVFLASDKEFRLLTDYLGRLCATMDLSAIHLIRGDESFLVCA